MRVGADVLREAPRAAIERHRPPILACRMFSVTCDEFW
jgi:hypothetical protein